MSTLVVQSTPQWTFEIDLPEAVRFTPTDFKELCSKNRDLQAELSKDGNLIIMAPTGGSSAWRNSKLTYQLEAWVEKSQNGMAFDSSTVFQLPNGAMRGPDAAWIRTERWEALSRVYRPNQEAKIIAKPDELVGDPELPGLVIRLTKLW